MNKPLDKYLRPYIIEPSPIIAKRGRPPKGECAMTRKERKAQDRAREREERLERIAVLDFETDPFDKEKQDALKPFLAVLYRDDAEPVVIWEENEERFYDLVISAIEALPGKFTVYAHNGGKFDFMFFLHRIRGRVSFKGRGIMACRIGRHELRDSFHIIPEKLANYKKDDFDYTKLYRANRDKYRKEIIDYCINDCAYLLDIVKKFISEFGLKLSIGQAAMSEMKKHYKVKPLGEYTDAFFRNYFFGGRVECLAGRGNFTARGLRTYSLYDVNSMYPFVMAFRRHPVGNSFIARRGQPNEQTVFMELTCRNFGALVTRGEDGEISAEQRSGVFRTTIWEYETALKYDLIENVKINWCIDFAERSDFSDFILPFYTRRQETKERLKTLTMGTREYDDAKKDDIFFKLILNNAYGKYAQNPRKFREAYVTDPGERPDKDEGTWGLMPRYRCERFWIWERPQKFLRFNNVATAASITGAARAVLMEAIALADDPIYCDTDSLMCARLNGLEIDGTQLGAWKLEHGIDEAIIAGKKLYAVKVAGLPDGHKGRIKVRSKGSQGLGWRDFEALLRDEIIKTVNPAPTMTKLDTQHYMRRDVRATVPRGFVSAIRKRKLARA